MIDANFSYDPTFSYELAVILQDGTRRMMQEQEDVYYYITVMNENYAHPDLPKGSEEGIVKVRLKGACGSCPMSTMTLTMGIERAMLEQIPAVKEVVQVP